MRFLFLILALTPALGTEFQSHIRERRQNHQGNYQGYNQAPAAIRQILAAQQARDPIVHLPPQPVPNLGPARPIEPQYVSQSQLTQYRPQVQVGQQPPQPTYKQIPVRPAQYNPPASARQQYNSQASVQQPYNPQYRTNYAPQPQLQPRPQPQQQVAQPNYQYSRNLPPQLQQLVQLQQNLPNAIPQGQQHG
ncbi:activating signal cointegrator 1 complex subunit 2-like protein [Lasius niger]|uniref:Activating signal cointegrator 1 complex subunit 2-like protein n=1 Tax=Lasius niger TaxID=67767 RepID=A0A0J7L7T7_LASNI|nr:activating signal cointegrator 1 complex subunit 2-like protein [Lasius niger]